MSRVTGTHHDEPQFDRDHHLGLMVRCRCGGKFLADPWNAPRSQCPACDEDDAHEAAQAEA